MSQNLYVEKATERDASIKQRLTSSEFLRQEKKRQLITTNAPYSSRNEGVVVG